MTTESVINALLKRRKDLTDTMERHYEHIQDITKNIDGIDKTIALFNPNYKSDGAKPVGSRMPENWLNRSQLSRNVLEVLRKSSQPMTSRDIVEDLMTSKGLDVSDKRLAVRLVKKIGSSLYHLRSRGVVRSIPGAGLYQLWEIAK